MGCEEGGSIWGEGALSLCAGLELGFKMGWGQAACLFGLLAVYQKRASRCDSRCASSNLVFLGPALSGLTRGHETFSFSCTEHQGVVRF